MALPNLTWWALESRVGPNKYSTAGAAVGLMAILLPWMRVEYPFRPVAPPGGVEFPMRFLFGIQEFTLLDLMTTAVIASVATYCLLFVAGTLVAFVSPIGAVPQIIGLTGFALVYGTTNLTSPMGVVIPDPILGLGFWLGMASAVIVIQAPMRSMLAANNGKPVRMLGRFAALSPRTISSWR